MELEELEAEYRSLQAERDRMYWLFTRTARAKPVPATIHRRLHELEQLIAQAKNNSGVITFTNGSTIAFNGSLDPSQVRGTEIDYWYIDDL